MTADVIYCELCSFIVNEEFYHQQQQHAEMLQAAGREPLAGAAR